MNVLDVPKGFYNETDHLTLHTIFGYATEGPRTGEQLTPTKSYMGYWFAWGTFYPQPEIYE